MWFVAAILSALEAKALIQRKVRHKELGTAALAASQILTAQATIDRDEHAKSIAATLRRHGPRYVLQISRFNRADTRDRFGAILLRRGTRFRNIRRRIIAYR